MKRITVILVLTTLAALAASPLIAAGVPSVINLQGRFTDAAGNNVADGVHTVVFRIYDDPIAGNTLWSETLPVQVTGGLFTVLVGNSTAIPAEIFSNGANRYLGVTVNAEPEMPRIPLSSVAYAYQTQDADVATLAQDLICASCVSAGEIAANAVGAAEIATGAVVGGLGGDIADGSVTADDLGTNSVGADEIATGAVVGGPGGDIADGSVTADDLGTNSVGADEIAAGAVAGGQLGDIADGSITFYDLGTNSVGPSEIATDAVGADEIDTDAVGSAEIAVGAVGSSEASGLLAIDLRDEPGVASDAEGITSITMDGTIQNLLFRSITAPAAGYVLVIATAQVAVNHVLIPITPITSFATFGVSTSSLGFPVNQDVVVQVPGTSPTGTYAQAVTVHGLFSTPGGLDNFWFLGDEGVGNFSVADLQLTVIYFPTAYGIVAPLAAASGGETMSSESAVAPPEGAETGSVLPETGSQPVQGENVDQPVSKQELALLKAEMEARIQELEELLRQNQSGTEEKK
jgi:hypothetical protein